MMRAVFLGAFVGCLALAFRAEADETAAAPSEPPPVRWADVSQRVAQGDAPLHVQVRMLWDGRVLVRRRAAKPDASWEDVGQADLSGSRAETIRAVGELRALFGTSVAGESLRDAAGVSRARLLFDVDSTTPWKYVDWALRTAASPQVNAPHATLLSPGGRATLDLEAASGEAEAGRVVTVAFGRESGGEPGGLRTRVGIRSRERAPAAAAGDVEPEDEVDLEDEDEGEAGGEGRSVDLAPDGAAAEVVASRWKAFEELLAKTTEGAKHVIGRIEAPPPTGGDTPYRDVFAGALLLRAAGAVSVSLAGSATPLPK